ncbi:MAG TPA: hypothetical protein PK602_05520, partial [Methanothrix sp.]|nr:hypothetical protein [Methanothrix sp.]
LSNLLSAAASPGLISTPFLISNAAALPIKDKMRIADIMLQFIPQSPVALLCFFLFQGSDLFPFIIICTFKDKTLSDPII